MLLELKSYLQERQQASLLDMAHHFRIPEGAVYDMMEHWVQKGYVELITPTTSGACGGCSSCSGSPSCASQAITANSIYRWKA